MKSINKIIKQHDLQAGCLNMCCKVCYVMLWICAVVLYGVGMSAGIYLTVEYKGMCEIIGIVMIVVTVLMIMLAPCLIAITCGQCGDMNNINPQTTPYGINGQIEQRSQDPYMVI